MDRGICSVLLTNNRLYYIGRSKFESIKIPTQKPRNFQYFCRNLYWNSCRFKKCFTKFQCKCQDGVNSEVSLFLAVFYPPVLSFSLDLKLQQKKLNQCYHVLRISVYRNLRSPPAFSILTHNCENASVPNSLAETLFNPGIKNFPKIKLYHCPVTNISYNSLNEAFPQKFHRLKQLEQTWSFEFMTIVAQDG